jgi:tRNA(Ser,Leu) C12 N-acetylase TAN1
MSSKMIKCPKCKTENEVYSGSTSILCSSCFNSFTVENDEKEDDLYSLSSSYSDDKVKDSFSSNTEDSSKIEEIQYSTNSVSESDSTKANSGLEEKSLNFSKFQLCFVVQVNLAYFETKFEGNLEKIYSSIFNRIKTATKTKKYLIGSKMIFTIPDNKSEALRYISKVKGLESVSLGVIIENDKFKEGAVELIENSKNYSVNPDNKLFKVKLRRRDKSYSKTSYDVQCEIGKFIQNNTSYKIDLKNPQILIAGEIGKELSFLYLKNPAYYEKTSIRPNVRENEKKKRKQVKQTKHNTNKPVRKQTPAKAPETSNVFSFLPFLFPILVVGVWTFSYFSNKNKNAKHKQQQYELKVKKWGANKNKYAKKISTLQLKNIESFVKNNNLPYLGSKFSKHVIYQFAPITTSHFRKYNLKRITKILKKHRIKWIIIPIAQKYNFPNIGVQMILHPYKSSDKKKFWKMFEKLNSKSSNLSKMNYLEDSWKKSGLDISIFEKIKNNHPHKELINKIDVLVRDMGLNPYNGIIVIKNMKIDSGSIMQYIDIAVKTEFGL